MLRELGPEGRNIPMPSKVVFALDEDFEGDPIIQLTVEFPAEVPVEDSAWKLVHPLLDKLGRLVEEKTEEEYNVLTDIRRLAETYGE